MELELKCDHCKLIIHCIQFGSKCHMFDLTRQECNASNSHVSMAIIDYKNNETTVKQRKVLFGKEAYCCFRVIAGTVYYQHCVLPALCITGTGQIYGPKKNYVDRLQYMHQKITCTSTMPLQCHYGFETMRWTQRSCSWPKQSELKTILKFESTNWNCYAEWCNIIYTIRNLSEIPCEFSRNVATQHGMQYQVQITMALKFML